MIIWWLLIVDLYVGLLILLVAAFVVFGFVLAVVLF